MRIELIGLLGECVILSAIAFIYLSSLGKTVTKVFKILWEVLCGYSTLLLIFQMLQGVSRQVTTIYIWECLLSFFGCAVVYYGEKYEKKMLGLYALIMDVVAVVSVGYTIGGGKDGFADVLEVVMTISVLMGYSAMTVLCCLSTVARKRPAKVKRWLRISFLFLSAAVLLGALRSVCHRVPLWQPDQNMVLVAWLIVCGLLHRKKQDSKLRCLLPYGLVVCGMLVRCEARLSLVALIGGGIGAVIVILRQSEIRIPEVDWKNRRILIRLVTYGYAAGIFVGTLIPFLAGTPSVNIVYDVLTIAYCILISGLLVEDQERLSRLQYIAVIVWNTVIILAGMLLVKGLPLYVTILLWICLLPVTCNIVHKIEVIKEIHSAQHLMCSVGVVGAVALISGGWNMAIYFFLIGGVGVIACMVYRLFFGSL